MCYLLVKVGVVSVACPQCRLATQDQRLLCGRQGEVGKGLIHVHVLPGNVRALGLEA